MIDMTTWTIVKENPLTAELAYSVSELVRASRHMMSAMESEHKEDRSHAVNRLDKASFRYELATLAVANQLGADHD